MATNNKKCYLCSRKEFVKVKGKVRDIPDMPILKCKGCGLVFLGNFDHIREGFYEGSLMRAGQDVKDWKKYLKECARDDARRAKAFSPDVAGKTVLDFGCGGGGFLKKIKGIAKSCSGVGKDSNLKESIREKFGITVYCDIDEVKGKFDFITMFHVLEHFKDPRNILSRLSGLLSAGGRIIIEVPNANDALLSLYTCKPFSEFTYWRCHLYLFNDYILKKLVDSAGLVVDYIKQIQRYPLSNHLYGLARGKPGGHKIWSFMDDKKLNQAYEARLARKGACDTIIASVRKARSF